MEQTSYRVGDEPNRTLLQSDRGSSTLPIFNGYAADAIDDELTPVAHRDTRLNAWGASAPWPAPNWWLVEQKSYRVGDERVRQWCSLIVGITLPIF